MSSNLTNESADRVLAGRSLVVVLRERKKDGDNKRDHGQSCLTDRDSGQARRDNSVSATLQHQQLQSGQRTGSDIFNDFICENNNCYWNPHLEESVRNLKYIGYLHPTTLLVGGRDIYVDTVRGAWTRRALRPPKGFHIVRIGDLESLESQPIHQAQFTPLPEALCMTITDLNRSHTPATFDVIHRVLTYTYRRVHAPSEEIIYETLGSLIREHKIIYSGGSYFAMTPDLHMVRAGCIVVRDNHLVIAGGDNNGTAPGGGAFPQFPTLLIPLGVATEKRSISCQTDGAGRRTKPDTDSHQQKLDTSASSSHHTTDDDPAVTPKRLFERSRSVRESRRKSDKTEAALTRSESLRYSNERSTQVVKDINLKTSVAHQNKAKGEKTSLLSKLFGRNKKRSLSVGDRRRSVKAEVEYATFSAQFPPPDMAVQMSRMQLQHRHAATWRQDAATQSEGNGDDDDDYGYSQLCPVHANHTGDTEQTLNCASGVSKRIARKHRECVDSHALPKSAHHDHSVMKSHGKRNIDHVVKSKKHDLKASVSRCKQSTDTDAFIQTWQRDTAAAMSTPHDLRETVSPKRSDAKSTRKETVSLHCQMDVISRHVSRSDRHESDRQNVHRWSRDSKHMSTSCHRNVGAAPSTTEREVKSVGQDQCGRNTKYLVQTNQSAAATHVIGGNVDEKIDPGKRQPGGRRRSRRMVPEDGNCHEAHPRDHDVNNEPQWNSPMTLLNNGFPDADHMGERDGHRLRVFQKYREMYSGPTLDDGDDAAGFEYCGQQLPRGASRDSGVNFIGLATPRNRTYPTDDIVIAHPECLQDSGFNSPRVLQITPSVPLAQCDGATYVQNLRHLPDDQPCPAGGATSHGWPSTDVGDACGFSWSGSSRQTVRPAGESSPRTHPKHFIASVRHGDSPEHITVSTNDSRAASNEIPRIRARDKSPKKHGVVSHHQPTSRAIPDNLPRQSAESQKHPRDSYIEPEGATVPQFREGLLVADGGSGQYMSYNDLGDYKVVAVV